MRSLDAPAAVALHDLTALEQRELLRRRDISATELLEHYLDRIAEHSPRLGAFVRVTEDLARREAAAADVRLKDSDGELPPLLGLPMGFKDLHLLAGVPTQFCSAAIPELVSPVDGHTVGRLRRAGVVTVGTTQAPEFGPTCYTETDVVDQPAVTPYDTDRYASGSSGGAAAAVAAGLLPFAHASDGAGSTRTPAAVCGLVGIKASRGRVSLAPQSSFQSWGSEGPLARTVADAALLLDVMAEPPPGELYALARETSFLEAARNAPSRPLRIVRYADPGLGLTVDSEVGRALDLATATLLELGHVVVERANPRPWDDQLLDAMLAVFGAGLLASARGAVPPDRWHLLRPYSRWSVEYGEKIGAADYLAATGQLAHAASAHLTAAADYDVVLTPTTTQPAVPVGWFSRDGVENEGRHMLGWSAFTPWANLTGQPSLSLPVHMTPEGLPVGVMLTGARCGDDALLISLAGQLADAVGVGEQHPAQW